jgi:hypothetical protein
MRGRAIGLGVLGLGAFLLAAALCVRLFLAPALVKLPLDQEAQPVAVGTDVAFFDLQQQKQLRGLGADVQQRVAGDPTAAGASADVAVWNFGSTMNDSDGNLLNASTYRVCIDRRTAVAVDCESTHVDYDKDARIEGLTLTFPFGTDQRDHDVYNATVGKAFPATFEGAENLQGLDVYRFQVSIPETVIKRTQVPGALVGSTAAEVTAEVVYSNERTMWVEPTSGVIVTAEEHPVTVLRGPDGADGVTLLAGDFAADQQTVSDGVARAEDVRGQITMVQTVLPLSLAGLGVVLLIVGGLLLRRRAAGVQDGDVALAAGDDTHRVPQVQ